ncbi:hypothetical protein [Cytophaga aurantiaca]|uniref:hypothetical protein n=1 Tax=Cytophaga aurantiaca TaxID=29530 RepID=UPI00035DF6C1|nr:hypothetical protein [Cytophaga aurantiaca]
MKYLIYLSLFLISNLAFCQNKKLNNPSKPGDTTRWDKQIALNDIKHSEYNWYFRLYTDKQVIDVWEDTAGKTFGEITCWTKEHTSNYKKPSNSIFSEKSLLNSIQLSKVISLINSSQIYAIPDQDSIKGWEQGFDGITYTIEHKIKTDYAIKSYWTPQAQGSLTEALLVQNFVDGVLKAVAAKEVWDAFASRIPFTCYINGGPMITCKVQSREEW